MLPLWCILYHWCSIYEVPSYFRFYLSITQAEYTTEKNLLVATIMFSTDENTHMSTYFEGRTSKTGTCTAICKCIEVGTRSYIYSSSYWNILVYLFTYL